jgi:hypothetical protein
MRAATLSLFVLGLSACTPMEWVRPDTDPAQKNADAQACQQAAWREAQFHAYWYQHQFQPIVVGPGRVVYPTGAYVDPFAFQLMQENRLAQFCMESKGYQLVPAPKP